MDLMNMAKSSKKASIKLAGISRSSKDIALKAIATLLNTYKSNIIEANQKDLERSKLENLATPLLKRLKFDDAKINEAIKGIESLISLDDPVGNILETKLLDDDLKLYKMSCSIGVIGVIFESRPDALIQISTLCLKSGNSVILKGGREALETNRILAKLIKQATEQENIPSGWIHLVETRDDVKEMLSLDDYIDLIIPRGSNDFVKYIMSNTKIPVLGHADGICHCYVDEDSDENMAVSVITDSKTQYTAVCNALETLLVHKNAATKLLPILKSKMDSAGVTLVGCEKTRELIDIDAATEQDWSTEYLDYKLSIKIVDDLDEAIKHINAYGSGHTDVIVTNNNEKAEKFMNLVDSGNVFWNASTRFSDGYKYGMGAEVGISTNKIHARGPVGLEGLVIYKYKLIGNGHIVSDYADGKKNFKHSI